MRDLAFCRQFTLDRQRLSRMIMSVANNERATDESIAAAMGVNPYMVTGFRGWFRKTGLGIGVSGDYRLTPFGALVAKLDPELQQPGTLWLLHYYLCSQHEERAEVWFRCFNDFLAPGQTFSPDELQTYIERNLDQTPSNTKGVASDTKELIKTYTQPLALGDLGILGKHGKRIEVAAPRTPEPLIAAYVLFDSWPRRFGDADVVRLSQIASEPESIGRMFVTTLDQVRQRIIALQGLGLVNYADTQHEPVTRRFHGSPLQLLERYYQEQ